MAGIFTYNVSCFVFAPLLHGQETHTETHMRLSKQTTHMHTCTHTHTHTHACAFIHSHTLTYIKCSGYGFCVRSVFLAPSCFSPGCIESEWHSSMDEHSYARTQILFFNCVHDTQKKKTRVHTWVFRFRVALLDDQAHTPRITHLFFFCNCVQ